MVCPGICCGVRLGLGLRVSARRVAVRTGGGDLVFSRGAAMVACELMDRCGLFRPQKGRQSEGIRPLPLHRSGAACQRGHAPWPGGR